MTRKQIGAVVGTLVLAVAAPLLILALLHSHGGDTQAAPVSACTAPDNGSGTITLPPLNCEYVAPDEPMMIIDGLPPGTTIELDPILDWFICSNPVICSMPLGPGQCETAGGSLGGHGCCADATLDLTVTGTGSLAGFNRHLAVPVALEAHSGPRTPGDPVQTFDRDMYRLQGELFGDPDFCEFIVTAGTDFGLPGPGQTTLTKLPSGDFAVDSFFDITYQIEFEGCPDSQLADYAGTTTETTRILTGLGGPYDTVKWEQEPDLMPTGLDVMAQIPEVNITLADDFQCTETGYITQIDFWGSWYQDELPYGDDPEAVSFTLSLHSDIPAGGEPPWSHPGELLWLHTFLPGECQAELYASELAEGWFYPPEDYYEPLADSVVWLYRCPIPEEYWFYQEEGTIYWLDVTAYPEAESYFGWKTSLDHWNDDGTWASGPEPIDPSAWAELRYPLTHPMEGASIDLAFRLWGREAPVVQTNKWQQTPDLDPTGIDISANDPDFVLADDFQCTTPGPITEIHVWGSWLGDVLPDGGADDVSFSLSIHEDVPAGGGEPSHPGELLWLWESPEFTVRPYQVGLDEGWLEPPADYTPSADTIAWDYTFNLDPAQYCTASDNGSDTADLPAANCDYVSPGGPMEIIQGLPPGTTIEMIPTFDDYVCNVARPWCTIALASGVCEGSGGSFSGGTASCAEATLELAVTGTGDLAGFNRTLWVPIDAEFHWALRTPGDPVQTFDADMYRLEGELFGDPDFCTLRVRAGRVNGLPGPGQTTLAELPTGAYAVDSFFDITYQIEFEGCPGSQLADYAGTTTGLATLRYGPPSFVQEGTPEDPIIYWLDVQADSDEGLFGWKTSLDHWNDDGTWAIDTEPVDPSAWSELVYPAGHPMVGESIDLAFEIWGREVPVEEEETYKWLQEPDVNSTGMDVRANYPDFVLADDLQCTAPGPITEIVIWGSWLDDILPAGGADDVSFSLSIHEDVPAAGEEPSHPGNLLWLWESPEFTVDLYQGGLDEGWLEPPDNYTPSGDTIAWEYTFNVDPNQYCSAPDNGSGTVELPPDCDYIAIDEPMKIIGGLPPGTTIELDPTFDDYVCNVARPWCTIALASGVCEGSGGSFSSGTASCAEATLELDVTGTGSLVGFNRHLAVPINSEFHWASRTPGDPMQTFEAEMYRLEGELFGDPDFCEFTVTAGTVNGLAGPGQTTLTELPSGDFAVESFFDVTYQIEFEGCPDSQLADYAGTTTATATLRYGPDTFIQLGTPNDPIIYWLDVQADSDEGLFGWKTSLDQWNDDGAWAPGAEPVGPLCRAPDNGTGTSELPATEVGCEYIAPDDTMHIIEGLPPGTTIELDPIFDWFICNSPPCETPGGTLGGTVSDLDQATLDLDVSGTGSLAGFNRHLSVPISTAEFHWAPRTPGDPEQTFSADMFRLNGQLFGDPDFCTFIITAGTDYGLPGPGQTTLTELPSGDFAVESFFDVTYQIEFEGCPDSQLADYAGTTTATVRLELQVTEWSELVYPTGHPMVGQSVDLAFAIQSEERCTAGVDTDGDTFNDDIEWYLPTDCLDDCPDWTGTPGLCPGPTCDGHDAWPLDNNVDKASTVVGDVLNYVGNTGKAVGGDPLLQRLDLNADGSVTVVGDVLAYPGNTGIGCS